MKRILFLLLVSSSLFAQSPEKLADSLKSGFRGLSVVNKQIIWMSGRKGLVGVSTNSGEKWKWNQVKEFSKLDFRSLHAFDAKHALMASAGTPAVILETRNGGKKWTTRFRSDDSAMFFDGMAFWDETHGIIFGDPVNGRMFLMETMDAGKTWNEIPFADRPQLEKGEASFAASGTSICVLPGGHVWTATGGTRARLFHSRDYGHHWETIETPMIHGEASQGIFSVAFFDTLNGVIAGGDYLNDSLTGNNIFTTKDGGKNWLSPAVPVQGYFSCVAYTSRGTFSLVAAGTYRRYYSHFGGSDWGEYLRGHGANTVRVYSDIYGTAIVFCGSTPGFKYEYTANENFPGR